MQLIYKVAALPIRNTPQGKEVMLCHKQGEPVLINMGGRKEPTDTSDEECLRREMREEAQVEIKDLKHFITCEGKMHNGNPIKISYYLCSMIGEPKLNPEDKVDSFFWYGKHTKNLPYPLASITAQQVIPKLIKDGLL